MPVWKSGSSLSQYTLCLSGRAYYPWVIPLYVPAGVSPPFRQRVPSFSQFTIRLSSRAYHPWVTPMYACPSVRTILESLHCMPVPARVPSVLSLSERTIIPKSVHYRPPVARTTLKSVHIGLFWSAYDSWFSPLCAVQKGVTSLIQSIIWLAGKAYHPWGNPLHVYFYFCCVISALNKDTDCYFIQIPYGQVVCFYVLCCVGSRFSNYVF